MAAHPLMTTTIIGSSTIDGSTIRWEMVMKQTGHIIRIFYSLLLFGLFLNSGQAHAAWDFSKHTIPLEAIQSGGPSKDGIPALNEPRYVPKDSADFMRADEQVLGVVLNGVARAYPHKDSFLARAGQRPLRWFAGSGELVTTLFCGGRVLPECKRP